MNDHIRIKCVSVVSLMMGEVMTYLTIWDPYYSHFFWAKTRDVISNTNKMKTPLPNMTYQMY